MTPLWKSLLRSDLPPGLFEVLHYTIFGLGDSSHEKFCWPAKKLTKRLGQFSASFICPRAEGDTQHTLGYVIPSKPFDHISEPLLRIDGAFEPWVETILHGLLTLLPLPPNLSLLPSEGLPMPRVTILLATVENLQHERILSIGNDVYRTFEFTANERIAADDWHQDVQHLVF